MRACKATSSDLLRALGEFLSGQGLLGVICNNSGHVMAIMTRLHKAVLEFLGLTRQFLVLDLNVFKKPT